MSHRLHGLDFCRAVMMILGIFYHSALIWTPENEWRVATEVSSSIFSYFVTYIQSFRMEVFFIIAGFFYLLVYEKNRPCFIRERIERSAVPFLFSAITLAPLLYLYSPNYDYPDIRKFFLYGHWIGHLWFLANLTVYFAITYIFIGKIAQVKGLNQYQLLALYLLIMPCVAIVFRCIGSLMDITLIIFKLKYLLYYYSYFILGTLSYTNKNTFIKILSFRSLIGASIILTIILLLKSYFDEHFFSLSKILDYVENGAVSLIMLIIVYKVGNRESGIIRSISDSSYTVYLLHMPLILILYNAVFSSLTNIYTSYIALVITVFIVSHFTHIIVVKRSNYLLYLLNGVRAKSTSKTQ